MMSLHSPLAAFLTALGGGIATLILTASVKAIRAAWSGPERKAGAEAVAVDTIRGVLGTVNEELENCRKRGDRLEREAEELHIQNRELKVTVLRHSEEIELLRQAIARLIAHAPAAVADEIHDQLGWTRRFEDADK